MKTQCNRVLAHLEAGKKLTQFEALTELGIMRLASRISDLNRDGHIIRKEMVEVSNRWGEKCRIAQYTLVRKAGINERIAA
jgi:Helix-turn-helix domain